MLYLLLVVSSLYVSSLGARLPVAPPTDDVSFPSEFIIGGEAATPGEFPWQGSMMTLGLLHSCGCVLISERWLVTAAHCALSPNIVMSVVLGMHDQYRRCKGDPTSYSIARKYRHANWSGDGDEGYPNDIAMLRLRRAANVASDYIGVIDLAPDNADFTNAECYITGWGLRRPGWFFGPGALQKAKTTVMSAARCADAWGALINDGHICVGGDGAVSGCMGDSGGPLVCKLDDIWVLAGVTSWGSGRCDPAFPSVYTRISYFRSWITDITNGDL